MFKMQRETTQQCIYDRHTVISNQQEEQRCI